MSDYKLPGEVQGLIDARQAVAAVLTAADEVLLKSVARHFEGKMIEFKTYRGPKTGKVADVSKDKFYVFSLHVAMTKVDGEVGRSLQTCHPRDILRVW